MRSVRLHCAIVCAGLGALALAAACGDDGEGGNIALNASSSGIALTFSDGGPVPPVTVPITIQGVPGVIGLTATPSRLLSANTSTELRAITASDGGTRVFAWTATAPCTGTFSAPTSEATRFTVGALPATGSCTLAVAVTGTGTTTATGQITLPVGPQGAIEAGANAPPVVELSVQSTTTPAGGEAVVLRVQARDPDGPTATTTWAATAGALSAATTNGGTSEVTWTAPACPASTSAVTATITDGESAVTTRVFNLTTVCL